MPPLGTGSCLGRADVRNLVAYFVRLRVTWGPKSQVYKSESLEKCCVAYGNSQISVRIKSKNTTSRLISYKILQDVLEEIKATYQKEPQQVQVSRSRKL